jgi:hypothetical protein
MLMTRSGPRHGIVSFVLPAYAADRVPVFGLTGGLMRGSATQGFYTCPFRRRL